MQKRSNAYQAIISTTLEHLSSGIAYGELVRRVAFYVDPDRAAAYRLGRLRRTPHETDAETTAKGQHELARKYIDSAHRQGLILYGDATDETQADATGIDYQRYVFWRRFARNGGRYSTPEAGEELRRHQNFLRTYIDYTPDT